MLQRPPAWLSLCGVCITIMLPPPYTLHPFPTYPLVLLQFLEHVLHAPASLAELRTVDEAVVIGAALSLSSSAFVLQVIIQGATVGWGCAYAYDCACACAVPPAWD